MAAQPSFPSWNKRTFVWNTNLPDDGSYENFIGGIASQPTKLSNVGEVNQSIGDILEYFDNDSTRFTVFLSRFLDKNYSLYYKPTEQEKQRELEKEKAKSGPKVAVEIGDGKKEEVTTATDLGKAQKMRRRASQAAVHAHLTSDAGRRLSKLDKDLYLVDQAIQLANQEQQEDEKLGKDTDIVDPQDSEEHKDHKHLPYIPVEGDVCDELLAEQLNVYEIDVDIRPLQLKKKKKRGKGGKKKASSNHIFYRICGKKRRVKVIHGVLLVREKKEFIPLIPHLRKLAGLPELDQNKAIETIVKKKKKKTAGK